VVRKSGYSEGWRAGEGGGGESEGYGAGGIPLPNFDAMTPEERAEYFRLMDEIMSGSGCGDTEKLRAYANREPAFNEHGDPQDGGEGYGIGCLAQAWFNPSAGACLELPYNYKRWKETQRLDPGQGVTAPPPDLDDLLPQGYAPPGADSFDDGDVIILNDLP